MQRTAEREQNLSDGRSDPDSDPVIEANRYRQIVLKAYPDGPKSICFEKPKPLKSFDFNGFFFVYPTGFEPAAFRVGV